MPRSRLRTAQNSLNSSRNWEENVLQVIVKPCDLGQDPVGYKAIFYLNADCSQKTKKEYFEIGASFLAQRMHNLVKAGYEAPMTVTAIEAIEKRIGAALPIFLGIRAGHSGIHGHA